MITRRGLLHNSIGAALGGLAAVLFGRKALGSVWAPRNVNGVQGRPPPDFSGGRHPLTFAFLSDAYMRVESDHLRVVEVSVSREALKNLIATARPAGSLGDEMARGYLWGARLTPVDADILNLYGSPTGNDPCARYIF